MIYMCNSARNRYSQYLEDLRKLKCGEAKLSKRKSIEQDIGGLKEKKKLESDAEGL